MDTTMVNKSKWFWGWNDDKEEQWLGEMSRQGLHLVRPTPFGQYTFEQGESREYAYRLDFVTQVNKKADYYQLFRDAGWTHIGEMSGWQYWRKEIVDGKVPEIFTDNASKIQKYQRLLGFLLIFFPIYVIFLTNFNNRGMRPEGGFFSTLYEVVFFILFVVIMLFVFSMLMIFRRITTLKRK